MNALRQALGMVPALLRSSAWAALALCGCQCPRLTGGLPDPAEGAAVEAGAYAEDERVAALSAAWPLRVARAIDRVALLTGIDLREAGARATLLPFGDERRALSVRAAVVEGVLTPEVRVNLERIAAGSEDADALLQEGLGLAALEVAGARSGVAVAPWVSSAVASACDGALDRRLERLVRDDVLSGRPPGPRVDPADPRQAASTGAAAVLLLLERGGPDLVRRWLASVLDGEDAGEELRRLLREVEPPWGQARRALGARLAEVDARPWRRLAAAEAELAVGGRAAFLSTLDAGADEAVREELSLLAARAALAEGDVDAARAALRSLSEDAGLRLRDPLALAVLRVRAEAAPGGDPGAAARRLAELERDFPRTGGADRLRAELRLPEDAATSLAALRRRARDEGLGRLELSAVVRFVELLHRDHRDGEAQRVLDALGERASAPELEALARAVAEAARRPSADARAAAERRVAGWLAAPGESTRALVVESGAPAADALCAQLERAPDLRRAEVLALLGATSGAACVPHLVPAWRREPARLPADLEALAASVRLPELEGWLRAEVEAAPAPLAADLDATFAALRFDLPAVWSREHADVLLDLRSPVFAARQRAAARVEEAGLPPRAPTFVARLLSDPSPQLRREGVRAASAAGFTALLTQALADPAASVRRAAALGLSRHGSPAVVEALLARLTRDAAPVVRTAAGLALLEAAPRDPRVLPAVLDGLADDDPLLREAFVTALLALPEELLAPATLARLEAEAAQAQPHAPALSAWFRLLERRSGLDLGYYPGMPSAELLRLVARARERLLRTGGTSR